MGNDDSAFRGQIARLRRGARQELRDRAGVLEALLGQGADERIREVAHQIVGTAGSFDFAEISDAALAIEDALKNGVGAGSLAAELAALIALLRDTTDVV